MAKIQNEQLADLISIIQSENPDYTAQQIFEQLKGEYSLKEIGETMIELYCEQNHFSDPEKVAEIKKILMAED